MFQIYKFLTQIYDFYSKIYFYLCNAQLVIKMFSKKKYQVIPLYRFRSGSISSSEDWLSQGAFFHSYNFLLCSTRKTIPQSLVVPV